MNGALAFIGMFETIAILLVLLVLFFGGNLPDLGRGLRQGWREFLKAAAGMRQDLDELGYGAGRSLGGIHGKPAAEALTPDTQVAEYYEIDNLQPTERRRLSSAAPILFLAQGLGLGRLPFAPGTFGSLAGLALTGALLALGHFVLFVIAALLLALLAVPVCGAAERILRQKDPGSVVLDEIVAVPLCFVAWLAIHLAQTGSVPPPGWFVTGQPLLLTLGVFLAFRFFDVAKPWPVRRSQSLPGGWGVVVDDLLAAAYVNAVVLAVWGITRLIGA